MEIHADVVEFLPQHLIMPGLSSTEQATKAAKELIQVLNPPVPQTPFTIGKSQLYVIDILEKLFITMQTDKTHTKVVPREVPTIAPLRAPITVPPPGVATTVTLKRLMTPRAPMITQEDPIEYSRKISTVENKNQHQLKHRYQTRITQLSQEIN